MVAQRRAVDYFISAVEFTKQIHSLVPFVCKLLSSTTDSDVLEAVCKGFVACVPGDSPGSRVCAEATFVLSWDEANAIGHPSS